MLVTGSRNVFRLLSVQGSEIPKALLSSAKCSKKSRTRKRLKDPIAQTSNRLEQNFAPTNIFAKEGDLILPRPVVNNQFINDMKICQHENSTSNSYLWFSFQSYPYLFEHLSCILSQERLIQNDTSHLLSVDREIDDRVDSSLRKSTLSVLWCLHSAYYGLSCISFCKAICLMDSFISKVKVKPKYTLCVAAACYYIASKFERSQDVLLPTPESLVTLSKCGGTSTDLSRMVEIILSKLTPSIVASIGACSATSYDFLSTFCTTGVSSTLNESTKIQSAFISSNACLMPPTYLCRRLEMSLTSAEVVCFRPSCIALALLSLCCLPTDSPEVRPKDEIVFSATSLVNLSRICLIPWSEVDVCKSLIDKVLQTENFPYTKLDASAPLTWTLSKRTRRSISTSTAPMLPTIIEGEELKTEDLTTSLSKITLDSKSLTELSSINWPHRSQTVTADYL